MAFCLALAIPQATHFKLQSRCPSNYSPNTTHCFLPPSFCLECPLFASLHVNSSSSFKTLSCKAFHDCSSRSVRLLSHSTWTLPLAHHIECLFWKYFLLCLSLLDAGQLKSRSCFLVISQSFRPSIQQVPCQYLKIKNPHLRLLWWSSG